MTTSTTNISKFVLTFINENKGADNLSELWGSDDNQNHLKSVLSSHPLPKGKKSPKDPNAPKRGKSSYLFFCAAERDQVKTDNPDMSAKEITSELGLRWNKLKEQGDQAVSQYVLMAEEDKSRYVSQKASYSYPEVKSKKEKKVKNQGKNRS